MAKYEAKLYGKFDAVLRDIEQSILHGSMTANLEDGSDYRANDTRFAVRVFERYSMIGSNRVSLTVTLVGCGDELFLSAITAGGSQAMFFKINTFGEQAFLDKLVAIAERHAR